MAMLTPLRRYFCPRLWWSVALFSALVCFFILKSVQPYHIQPKAISWDGAEWIAPADESAVAYYRTTFRLAELPRRAVLKLAAPDAYQVYVNSQLVLSSQFASVNLFEELDVSPFLVIGENVISVRVALATYPGKADLIASLDWFGQIQGAAAVKSSPAWKVSTHRESQLQNSLQWYDVGFDDTDWQPANLSPHNGDDLYDVHPWVNNDLFNHFPRGEWIWSERLLDRAISLRREVEIDSNAIQHAWLGVASGSQYSITINTVKITAAQGASEYMDVYDIGRYLIQGTNTIIIDALGARDRSRVGISGLIQSKSGAIDISSGDSWVVDTGAAKGQPLAIVRLGNIDELPVVMTRDNKDTILKRPALRFVEPKTPGGHILKQTVNALPWVLLGALLIIVLISLLLPRHQDHVERQRLLSALALPFIAASLVYSLAIYLTIDVRLELADVLDLPTASAVAVMTLVWCLLMLVESRYVTK